VVASAAVGLGGPVILRLIRRSLDFVPSLVTP
jgi:hypothetical protein